MSVDIDAFAICEVATDACVVVRPLEIVEVHFVLEGILHLSVSGSSPIVLEAGGMAVVPPGHEQRMAGSATAERMLYPDDACVTRPDGLLFFDGKGDSADVVRIMCGAIRADVCGSVGLFDGLTAPLHASLGHEPLVAAAVETMLRECSATAPGARALTGALMKACLVLLLRGQLAAPDQLTALPCLFKKPLLARAVAAVLDCPTATHSVASLAAAAGMSRSSFAKEFASSLGVTPMEFVARTRIGRARDLLASTGLPVSVVAAKAGFASRSHFSRSFRSAFGADPSAYRKDRMRKEVELVG